MFKDHADWIALFFGIAGMSFDIVCAICLHNEEKICSIDWHRRKTFPYLEGFSMEKDQF